jgi:hypothetical protein
MQETLEDQIRHIVASMENEEQNNQEQEPPETTDQEQKPDETIHIHYFPDAIVILKENEETRQPNTIVETTLAQTKKPPVYIAYAICSFYLFLIFSCIAFQVYEILNPPVATVTIVPKAQTVTLSGTLQLGRLLNPITISQSQTTPATGKGHQDAKQAQGAITFYNGQLNSVPVAAGTLLTGSSGVQIVTDQDAYIPAESQTIPPTLGQTTISAHALILGTKGNIPTGDINQGCCAPSVLAQNPASFHGGQDERDFQTVAKADIASVATPLKTAVMQSMQGAFYSQLAPREQLQLLPCTPTQTSDHQPGQEAREVKISVSETCSAVAYNNDALIAKATELLSHQALQHLGTGYSLFGIVQVSITQATATRTTPTVIFTCQGTWVYGISQQTQQHIKQLIAGKSKQVALKLLLSLPGVENASIEGYDTTKLPKNITSIHFNIVVKRN